MSHKSPAPATAPTKLQTKSFPEAVWRSDPRSANSFTAATEALAAAAIPNRAHDGSTSGVLAP